MAAQLQAITETNMESPLYAEMAQVEGTHWWFRGRRKIILSMLTRFAPKRGPLLDVGMGTGLNAALFAKLGFAVDGLESAPEAITIAKEVAPNVRVIESSFPSSVVPANHYAVVTMLDVLEHLQNDTEALHEVARVLAPNGIVLITVPAFSFLWSKHDELAHHYRRYRRHELSARLREAGLEPQFVSYYNFFLFPAIALVRLATKALGIRKEGSDFSATPALLNGVLSALFGAERFLLRLIPLPFGVSVVAVAKKV